MATFEYAMSPKVAAFAAELDELCKKHGLDIGQSQDYFGVWDRSPTDEPDWPPFRYSLVDCTSESPL